jgi:hypothetical protein
MMTAKEITRLKLTEAWLKIAQLQRMLAVERVDLVCGDDAAEAEADAELEAAEAVVDAVIMAKVTYDVRHGR